jgi:hypothetical protein
MNTKRLLIRDLQPTDLPTDGAMNYYAALGDGITDLATLPQVWKVGDEYYISDGNNYVLMQAYLGNKDVEVDYRDLAELNSAFRDSFEEAIVEMEEGAKVLKDLGVTSVYDLVSPLVSATGLKLAI